MCGKTGLIARADSILRVAARLRVVPGRAPRPNLNAGMAEAMRATTQPRRDRFQPKTREKNASGDKVNALQNVYNVGGAVLAVIGSARCPGEMVSRLGVHPRAQPSEP